MPAACSLFPTAFLLMAMALVADPMVSARAQSVAAQDYARLCEKLISDVPAIDCAQGTEISMNMTGRNAFGLDECTEPSLLAATRCGTGSRLLRLTPQRNAADTELVFLCRAGFTPGRLDSVIGIQYSRRTGTTCWYHSFGHGRLSPGARLPSPAASGGGSPAWDALSISGVGGSACMQCHDGDPYIVTPFLARTDDANALPGLGAGETPLDWYNRPYASFFMRTAPGGPKLPAWPATIRMQPQAPNACAGCHGYGVYATVSNYLKNAVGLRKADTATHPTLWMPPTTPFTARQGVFADLDQSYRDAVAAIQQCQEELRDLGIPGWLARGGQGRPAEVAASFRRCGWHYSSIELAAVSVTGAAWQDNALHGVFRAANENRFAARDVRLAIRLENGGNGARVAEDVQSRTLAADTVANGAFVAGGAIPDQDAVRLALLVDELADPDLPDGEFLEVDEDDNRVSTVLRLNDLQVSPPSGATQLLPGTAIRLAFTVRNDGPLPVRGARTTVRITNAGASGLSCVLASSDVLKPDWRAGEARTLEVRLSNQCAVANRAVQVRVEADPDGRIPERAQANNVVSYTYTLPYPPPPPPHPGGPTDLVPTVNILTQLMKTRFIFSELCSRMRVTPDSNICTGLELLPRVRNPEDIVVPRPVPVPSPFLEEALEAVRSLQAPEVPQVDLARERLERALAGEPVDLAPLADVFSLLANRDVVAEDAGEGAGELSPDGEFQPAPGWSWASKAVTADVVLRPSDLLLADFGRDIVDIPFMWIDGPQARPAATLSVTLPDLEGEEAPVAVALIDGTLSPLEADWDPETRRIHVPVPAAATGIGFVSAHR